MIEEYWPHGHSVQSDDGITMVQFLRHPENLAVAYRGCESNLRYWLDRHTEKLTVQPTA